MREYETIFLVKPDLAAERLSDLKQKVQKIIRDAEGHVLSQADWGKRRLGYPVQKLSHAQYFYLKYLAKGPEVGEIERIFKYDDGVLKFLTVKLNDQVNVEERLKKPEEAPEAPEEIFTGPRDRSGHDYRSSRSGPRGSGENAAPEKTEVRAEPASTQAAESSSSSSEEPKPEEAQGSSEA